MLKYFEDLEVGIASKIREDPDRPNARKKFALEIARIGKRLYSGQNRVAWCGISAPFDLLAAMDVTSCFVEFVGAMLATTGFVGHFLEKAEQAGLVHLHSLRGDFLLLWLGNLQRVVNGAACQLDGWGGEALPVNGRLVPGRRGCAVNFHEKQELRGLASAIDGGVRAHWQRG